MASTGAFVSAAGQRSTAHIFARRTTSVATFALALMSLAVLHSLTFVLTMEFRLVGALKLLPMASTSRLVRAKVRESQRNATTVAILLNDITGTKEIKRLNKVYC